jgi:nucleoside-diphosphate-sugar epimerase
LVTGGAGYKGVVLAQKLLDQGHHVTVLDSFMYGYESVLHLLDYPRFDVVRCDVRNLTEATVKPYDAVFHLAGISGYAACEANPHSAKLINVDGSRCLGEALGRGQMLIYASTTSFYGKANGVCDEGSPVKPVSLYGVTKHQAEQVLMQRENSLALRFASVFGVSPRMRIDLLVNDFAYRAVTERCLILFEGRSRRTFVHILDAVAAYLFALEHFGQMRGQIFNVGHESLNLTKWDVAQRVQRHTGCKLFDSDLIDYDVRDFQTSFEKIERLGFTVTRTLDQGIEEMVKLYQFYRPLSLFKTI